MTDFAKYHMVPFSDAVVDVSRGNIKIAQSDFHRDGELAIVDQGQSLIAGFTDDLSAQVSQSLPLIVFGDHTRIFKYIDFPFAMGADGVKVLKAKDGFNTRFLYYYFQYHGVLNAGYSRHFKYLKDVQIPSFSMEYQKRVVEILDRADAIRAKRRQLLADYDELRANMFYDVFGVPSRWADSWSRTTIGALTESVQYGTSARAGTDGAWPILRMGNITDDGRLDLTDLKYIDLPETDIPKYTVRAGDMLFNRTNSKEKVGKSCVVDTDQKLALAGYLVRVRFRNPMHAPFVSAFLNSTYGVKLRQRMAKAAVNQANINATEMKSIEVPSPSDVALREFVRRVEAIAAARAKVERALALDDELFDSLQSRAFCGAL